MTCTVEIPDSVAEVLEWNTPPSSQQIIEMLLVERYREGKVSRGRMSELLSLSFWETEELLHRHGAMIDMSAEEFDRDSDAARQFLRTNVVRE